MAGYSTMYDPDTDFDRWYTDATADEITSRIAPASSVLELGCATGRMTARLAAIAAHVTAVDRDDHYLARAGERQLSNVTFVKGDLNQLGDFASADHVVATNVLHEVSDPRAFLTACRELTTPNGRIHVSLQNPHSIHRLVGIEMGLIEQPDEISDRGTAFDTLRMLDRRQLEQIFDDVGLRIVDHAGVLLKPLPNGQMAQLPDEIIAGFVAVAKHFPDHASMNYFELERR